MSHVAMTALLAGLAGVARYCLTCLIPVDSPPGAQPQPVIEATLHSAEVRKIEILLDPETRKRYIRVDGTLESLNP